MTFDQTYLREQYKTSGNLSARAALHARFSTAQQRWQHWVFDHLLEAIPSQAAILELGSGPGWLWIENLDRIPARWDVLLSDFSAGMVSTARENLRHSGHPFLYKRIDARNIPFVDGTFAAVIANHMLYHVPQLDRALAEIRRVLKPGGRFFAATNGSRHLKEIPDLLQRFDPALPYWEDLIAADAFRLENGADNLQSYFAQVDLHIYEDALVVTEIEPFIDYILSTRAQASLTRNRLAAFRQLVEAEMSATGALVITKDVGLFGAIRA